MADVAAARREARRRRILENSQNRLQLISGKNSDKSVLDSGTTFLHSDPLYEETAASSSNSFCLPPVNNGVIITETESRGFLSAEGSGDNEIVNDLAAFLPTTTTATDNVPPTSTIDKIFIYKYDVVLVALVIQFLYTLFTFETAYFFLPLITYSVTKLIWFPTQSKSNIANAVLLLNGLSPNRVASVMKLSQWFGTCFQDICLYLFVTICVQSVLTTVEDYILT